MSAHTIRELVRAFCDGSGLPLDYFGHAVQSFEAKPGEVEAGLRRVAEVVGKQGAADEARAAYWHAEHTIATQPPGSPAALQAVDASAAARARLDALGARP